MATNLQNGHFMNSYGVVGERDVGLKFYPRNTPLALISQNDITVTPIEVECTTADAGPAGLPFLLRFTSAESRKATVESSGIDNSAVPRKMLMWQS
ncbi:hypothetical protein [Marinobacterium aestuariivivens]|uniref:Uncharacterized protein n=1 Tax=Marinobacterium aestuariivivens TaxID=1698799 RepID=A0ABW2A9E1_9GAMM